MSGTVFADQDKVIFIGGAVKESDTNNERSGSAWVRRLQDFIIAHEPEKNLQFIDKTEIGQHFHDMRQRWDDDVMWHQPQYVCVVLGLDDAWTDIRGLEVKKDQASLSKELGELITYHKQSCPHTKFIFVDLPFLSLNDDPAWNTGQVLQRIKPLQAALASVAKAHAAVYVPLQTMVDQYLQREGDLCFGGEDAHPNIDGSILYAHAVYQALQAEIPASQDIIKAGDRIVFIGDSITDAGRRNNNGRPFGLGYMRLWRSLLRIRQAERSTTLQIFNRGVGGNTIRNLSHRWQTDCLDLNPDHLLVKIGINDINRTLSNGPDPVTVEDYQNILRDLLQQVRQHNPKCTMTLITPFYLSRCDNPINYRKKVADALPLYIAVLNKVAKEFDAAVVDLQAVFQAHLDHRSPAEFGARNGIDIVHPSETGALIMAEAVYAAFS